MVAFDRQAYMAGLLLPTKAEKMKEGYQIGPPWLRPLLTTQFFNSCNVHGDNNRNECNLYCLDCMGGALCSSCTLQHRDHHVVQIRRSSYHDVVRVSELQKVLDLTGVQTYIINSARVVFLNARPQPRHAKGVTKTCEICDRSLLDSYRYCSLGCKLTGIRRHNDMNFHLQPRQQQQQQQSGAEDTISMPEAPNPLPPAAPARSSVTSEDTTGSSGGGISGGGHSKRTRSSASRRAASPPRLSNEDESGTEDVAGTAGGAVENMYSSSPVRGGAEEGDLSLKTSIVQRSLGTLKLRSSSSAEVSCESEQPGSPMAVSSWGGINTELSPPTPPPTRTAKRRKGTPHRAPLGM